METIKRPCGRTKCSEQRDGDCASWRKCDYFVPIRAAKLAMRMEPMIPKEEDEQKALAAWCLERGVVMVHIPNEDRRSARVGGLLKAEGMQPGFPDNFFPYARQGWHGLFIELKRRAKRLSRVSEKQRQWIDLLRQEGYRAEICYGAEAARNVVLDYLRRTKEEQ